MLVATAEFLRGGKTATPIMFAYLILGSAAGALGVSHGLSAAEIALLSLMMYAGSAQFIFPVIYGAAPHAVAAAIFFVNLRHVLYSASLSQQARELPLASRTLIGAQLTDETYIMATTKLRGRMMHSASWMIGLNMTSYLSWFTGNMFGALAGTAVDLSVFGADFAGHAMFIALLFSKIAMHARWRSAATVAVLAGGTAVLCAWVFPGPAAVVVIAAVSAAAGVFIFGVDEDDREFCRRLRERES